MNVIVLGIAAALALLVFCFFLGWVVTSSTHRGKVRRHSVAGEDVFLPTSAMFLADSSAHESHRGDGHDHHGQHHGHHSHNHSGVHSHSHHDSGHHGHADHSGGFDAGSHAGHGGGFDGGGSFDAGGGDGHH